MGVNPLYSEQELIQQIAEGKEEGFSYLHRMYHMRLVYYVIQFSLTREEAEDVVGETFMKVWQSRSTFSSESHIRNFLYLTARHRALNLANYKERQVSYLEKYSSLESASEDAFSHERVETEMLNIIYQAMGSLPDECRKIFRLYLEDLSPKEIATQLSISPATVRSQKRRAISLLKKWLDVHLGGLLALWYILSRFSNIL